MGANRLARRQKALEAGRIHGDSAALRVLWAAASIADRRPVDLVT